MRAGGQGILTILQPRPKASRSDAKRRGVSPHGEALLPTACSGLAASALLPRPAPTLLRFLKDGLCVTGFPLAVFADC